jgi:uncharacterized protein
MKKQLAVVMVFFSLPLFGVTQAKKTTNILEINKNMFDMHLARGQRGDVRSMYLVARYYAEGSGCEKNALESIKWYQQSGLGGYGNSWYKLGMVYKYGRGVAMDFERAYECFSKGTNLGDPLSLYSKGYLLYKGIGCKQDYNSAFILFVKASDRGVHEAMYFLGLCYRNGYGTAVDKKLAKIWLSTARRMGDMQASQELSTTESEVSTKSTQIKIRLAEIEKISYKSAGSSLEYRKIQHDAVSSPKSFAGDMSGYLIKYDWSGQHILDIKTLHVSMKGNSDTHSFIWEEEDTEPIKINGKFTNEGFKLEKFTYKKSDHYNQIPEKISFSQLAVKTYQDDQNLYLKANITATADEKKEPERPQSIILIKPLYKATSNAPKEIGISTKIGDFVVDDIVIKAFPNPVSDHVTVVFTLAIGTMVTPYLFNMEGKQLYNGITQSFGKGTATLTIPVRQSSGQYIVKLQCGSQDTRTIKIIKL